MRLLTWNLSDLDVTTPRFLVDPRVDCLAGVGGDVACLQKLSGAPDNRGVEDGVRRLGAGLGMTGAAVGLTAYRRLHVAVLWREPMFRCVGVLDRPHGLRRNFLLIDLAVAGRRLRIGSVHLPSSSVADQLHDVGQLLTSVDQDTVLAGDWNATGADAAYDPARLPGDDGRVAAALDAARLVDAGPACGAPWMPTWGSPGGPPFVRIDGVRLSRRWAERLTGHRVHGDADDLSLHRPVEVSFDVSLD